MQFYSIYDTFPKTLLIADLPKFSFDEENIFRPTQ